jgi:hypothetical protein
MTTHSRTSAGSSASEAGDRLLVAASAAVPVSRSGVGGVDVTPNTLHRVV